MLFVIVDLKGDVVGGPSSMFPSQADIANMLRPRLGIETKYVDYNPKLHGTLAEVETIANICDSLGVML
jgi:hypothetical protein